MCVITAKNIVKARKYEHLKVGLIIKELLSFSGLRVIFGIRK